MRWFLENWVAMRRREHCDCLLAGLLPETCCEENLGGMSTSSFLFFLRIRKSAIGPGSISEELSERFAGGLFASEISCVFSLGSV